jgi:hypothetical protein
MFSGVSNQTLAIRALPAGAARINFGLSGYDSEIEENGLVDPPAAHGVDPDVVARFGGPPDTVDQDPSAPSYEVDGGFERAVQTGLGFGPVIVIAAHAEKGERIVTFDLSLGQPERSESPRPLTIQRNVLTTLDVPLEVEALFTNEAGALVFDDIAAADADGNGQISPQEVRRVNVPPCPGCTPEQQTAAIQKAVLVGDELATKLVGRSRFLFGL